MTAKRKSGQQSARIVAVCVIQSCLVTALAFREDTQFLLWAAITWLATLGIAAGVVRSKRARVVLFNTVAIVAIIGVFEAALVVWSPDGVDSNEKKGRTGQAASSST